MNLLWNRKNNKLLLHMHYSACIYATSHSPHSYVFWMICVLSLGKVVDEAQMGPLVLKVSFTACFVNYDSFSLVEKRQKIVKLPFLRKISRHEYFSLLLKITCYLLLIYEAVSHFQVLTRSFCLEKIMQMLWKSVSVSSFTIMHCSGW